MGGKYKEKEMKKIISKYGWVITENDSHNLKNCARALEIDFPKEVDFFNPNFHGFILNEILRNLHSFIVWDSAVDYHSGIKIFGISYLCETFEDFQKNLESAREDIEFLESFFGLARFHEILSEF